MSSEIDEPQAETPEIPKAQARLAPRLMAAINRLSVQIARQRLEEWNETPRSLRALIWARSFGRRDDRHRKSWW